MKKLYLIDGAAGTGKSDLIEYIQTKHSINANALFKYTTRPERTVEEAKKADLIFVEDDQFNDYIAKSKKNSDSLFYHYHYGGFKYGFFKKDLDKSISEYDNTFVIIRNHPLISQILNDYKYIAFTVHIYVYTDRSLVVERLKKDGFSDGAIAFRLMRSESAWQDYIENFNLNMKIIINNSNKSDFHRGINSMIDSRC